jgi:hypothetical protein
MFLVKPSWTRGHNHPSNCRVCSPHPDSRSFCWPFHHYQPKAVPRSQESRKRRALLFLLSCLDDAQMSRARFSSSSIFDPRKFYLPQAKSSLPGYAVIRPRTPKSSALRPMQRVNYLKKAQSTLGCCKSMMRWPLRKDQRSGTFFRARKGLLLLFRTCSRLKSLLLWPKGFNCGS